MKNTQQCGAVDIGLWVRCFIMARWTNCNLTCFNSLPHVEQEL